MTSTERESIGAGRDESHDDTDGRPTLLPASAPVPAAPAAASYIGSVCAVALVALGAIGIRDGIVGAGWLDGRLWSRVAVDWIDGQTFHGWMVPVGIIATVLGLLCVALAFKPRRKRAIALAARTSVYLELSDAAQVAAAAARSVPGIVDASANARRRRITVHARTTGADAAQQRAAVSGAVSDALEALADTPKVKVRLNAGGRR